MGMHRLVLVLALCCTMRPVHAADDPVIPPEELKSSVQKDCATFSSFCAAKHARIREALRRNGQAEATDVAERLLGEEARTLKRVIWYLGTDRKNKEPVEALQRALTKIEGTKADAALKACVESKFAKPGWLANPFEYKDGAGGDKDEKKDEGTITVGKGASTTNYGVSGGGASLDIKPVAAAAKPAESGGGAAPPPPPPPPPDPPPPPPPPPTDNPGGGGSGAGSGGSHSSQ